MLQFFDTLSDTSGNALVGATITVTNFPSGTVAPIYNTNGTASPIATGISLPSDVTGQVSFFIPDGVYTLTYKYNGTTYKTRASVAIMDPAGFVTATDTGGAANVYVINNSAYPGTLYVGLKLEMLAAHTNTGSSTLNLNGTGALPIRQGGGNALAAGMIQLNGIVRLEWDGTQFELIGSQSQPFYAQTAAEAAAGVTPTNFAYPPGDVRRYGAVGDGVTDDTTAILNSIASNQVTNLLTGNSVVSSAVSVPAGKGIIGAGLNNPSSTSPLSFGSILIATLALSIVVQIGDGTAVAGMARGFAITRAAGTPPAGSIGLRLFGGVGTECRDIFSWSHQIPIAHQSAGTGGLGHFMDHINTGAAYDAHVVVDTVPEIRYSNSRIGTNGTLDVPCSAYLRITGGNGAHPPAGPNTVIFTNTQFNSGNPGSQPTNWLQFVNLNAPGLPTIDARVFSFSGGCHIEGVSGAAIASDASWASIDRLDICGCTFNLPGIPFFNLNAATALNGWRFANNWLTCSTFAPGVNVINALTVTGNTFETAACTYNAVTGSWTVTNVGNTYGNSSSLTISGDKWNAGVFCDTYRPGSTFTNNANATVQANIVVMNSPGNSTFAWTPVLNFGGNPAGITYATQSGALQVVGNMVHYQWRITLTAKGANVGAATITGFPINHSAGLHQTGAGGVAFGNANMAGLPAAILAQGPVGGGAGQISLLVQNAAATAPVTDANFTNTSDIAGHVTFFL